MKDFKDAKEISEILSEDTCLKILNIYNEDLNEMARFGKVPDSQIEIHLEGSEGFIPHIHICKNNGKNILCRVKLLSNEYLRESDDKRYRLSRAERKALNKYLHSSQPYSSLSRWESLIFMWNDFNPERAVNPKDYKIPDYTDIEEPR